MLKEAQKKEQELNAEVRKCHDYLEATKVLYCNTIYTSCYCVGQSKQNVHMHVYDYMCNPVSRVQGASLSD